MKTAWIVAFALLFLSAASFAETPAPRVTLAQALGQTDCPAPESAVFLAAKPAKPGRPQGLEKSVCNALAQCLSGPPVTCTSNVNGTGCFGYDANCPSERGRVVCNGVTTWCSTPCPCSTGTLYQRACCRCELAGGDDCSDCYFCEHGVLPPVGYCD